MGNPLLQMGLAAQGLQNPVGQQPNGANTPLGATADPRSQYLAMALANTNKAGQNPGNATGLTGDLLASALERYGLNQQQSQGYYVNDQGQRVANPGPIPGGSAGGTAAPMQTPVPI